MSSRPTPDEQRELADAHLGRLLLQALRRVQASSVAKLQERGHPDVRTGHLPVFSNVEEEGTRITDLAARAGMTRQMMGRLVRELERQYAAMLGAGGLGELKRALIRLAGSPLA